MSGPFSGTSRYARTETSTYVDAQGRAFTYLQRRFVPPSSRFAVIQQYGIVQGDRLDNLAAAFFSDPEQYWRLCDANDAMYPDDLLEVGGTLRVALPEGIPAPSGSMGSPGGR